MTEPAKPKRFQTYEEPHITVTFDPNICIHSGICVRGLPAVFDIKRKRWIKPDLADAQTVADQVARCPSGALQVRWPNSKAPDPNLKGMDEGEATATATD
jgi:uncharacterized Fe-S cluster protein YjdI